MRITAERIVFIIIFAILVTIIGNYMLNPSIVHIDKIVNVTDTITTTRVDTIFSKPVTKYITKIVPKIIYVSINDSINLYQDTTYNDDFSLVIIDSIKGTLEGRSLEYELYVPKKITVYKDRLVTNTEIKIVSPKHQDFLILGGGYDYLNDSKYLELEYLRTNNRLVYGIGLNTQSQFELKVGLKL